MATASKKKKQGKHLEMPHLELLLSEVGGILSSRFGHGFPIKLDPETRKWKILQHYYIKSGYLFKINPLNVDI